MTNDLLSKLVTLPFAVAAQQATPLEMPETETIPETDDALPTPGEGYRVMLYNDDWHTMDAVIAQLIKAIRCTLVMAQAVTLRVHFQGKAVVTITDRDEADRIAGVLREIQLQVSVDQV